MTAEDDYLRAVERMLRRVAPEHRAAVLEDLRGHFADAEAAGRPVDEIIRSLGTPTEIADRAVEEFGADASDVDARAERAWRVLQGAAVVLAVVIGVVVAFIMPSHTIATSENGVSVLHHLTVFQNEGLWVALLALIPAVVAVVPAMVSRAARTPVSVMCGILLTAIMLIGGFTIGGFFLPTVLMSWAALITWIRLRSTGFGISWRVGGGVLTALPVILAFGSTGIHLGFWMPRRYADYTEFAGPSVGIESLGWMLLTATVALGVLLVIGYRWAGWVLAALGAGVLVAGLISGELLSILVIWLGGLWLTIGLAHALTASRRV